MNLSNFVRYTGSLIFFNYLGFISLFSAQFCRRPITLERLFFGSAGRCISKSIRRICIPDIFNEEHALNKKTRPIQVRVLLDQKEIKDGHLWAISGEHIEVSKVRFGKENVFMSTRKCNISIRHGELHINNVRCSSLRLNLQSQYGPLHFQGSNYTGSLAILIHNNKINLINCIDLEDYVYCVLRTESWPGWPVEVNKVLAIAIRTYVVAKIMENKRVYRKVPYHIKNTNIHQTYNGHHGCRLLEEAVSETEGVIMTYRHEPIVAMFDACCGGIIPALMDDIDFSGVPYLKRDYPCVFCSSSSLFNYKTLYTAKEMNFLLSKRGLQIGPIKEMLVAEKDNAGVVKKVLVRSNQSEKSLTKHNVYGLCKKIKSFAFDIKKSGNSFVFEGKGFGHHLGLCQWGSREMVAQGWKYKDILKFYYPGIQFMKISYEKK